ncbi:MAG: hypothetical protein KTR35_08850 [Gammaproteobacteria bacterium]|nr:hypothetical protein [Gammaproteobacteria bacterium]
MIKKMALAATLLMSTATYADSLDSLGNLDQGDFRTLMENIAAVSHYRGITPAEPLGTLGFDIGIALSATEIDNDLFELASSGSYDLSRFLLPRLHAHKGLPFGIDVGAFIGGVPSTDFNLLGAEVRYAIVSGNVALPAIAIRGGYTVLQGSDEIDLSSTSLDISISKGLTLITPYAGAGLVRTTGSAKNVSELDEETSSLKKFFVGVNLNLGANLTLEADRTGDYTTFSIKTGLRF